jgi:hypothetical protein
VTTLDELSAAVKEARALDVPAVIEVPIDPAEYHAHAAPPRQRRTPRVPLIPESPSLESIRYGATSKSFVAAEDPFTSTSSLYFPAGHPSGFET